MKIEILFSFIDTLRPAGQSGFVTPEDKEFAINYAQYTKFNEEKKFYGLNQDITDRLRVFERRTEPTPQGDYYVIPTDYARAVAFAHKDSEGKEHAGDIIQHSRWLFRTTSKIKPPIVSKPIMVIRDKIEVAPDDVNPVLYYLKQPAKVVFNYTEINETTVQFVESGSTDIEWREEDLPEILLTTLQYLGVPIKDDILLRFKQFSEATANG